MSAGRELVNAAAIEALKVRPTIAEMDEMVRAEANRIELVQAGLVDSGARAEPDAKQIRALITWDALQRLTDALVRNEEKAREFFRGLDRRGRG